MVGNWLVTFSIFAFSKRQHDNRQQYLHIMYLCYSPTPCPASVTAFVFLFHYPICFLSLAPKENIQTKKQHFTHCWYLSPPFLSQKSKLLKCEALSAFAQTWDLGNLKYGYFLLCIHEYFLICSWISLAIR